MPVFHRMHGGVLVVTVDGDFTVREVARVGKAGLASPELAAPARVLLDLSGTAGLAPDRLAAIADVFAEPDAEVVRLAVQGPRRVGSAVVEAVASSHLEAAWFTARADAMDWLQGG